MDNEIDRIAGTNPIGEVKPSTLVDLNRAADEKWQTFPLWIKYTCLFAVHIALEVSKDIAGRKRS